MFGLFLRRQFISSHPYLTVLFIHTGHSQVLIFDTIEGLLAFSLAHKHRRNQIVDFPHYGTAIEFAAGYKEILDFLLAVKTDIILGALQPVPVEPVRKMVASLGHHIGHEAILNPVLNHASINIHKAATIQPVCCKQGFVLFGGYIPKRNIVIDVRTPRRVVDIYFCLINPEISNIYTKTKRRR